MSTKNLKKKMEEKKEVDDKESENESEEEEVQAPINRFAMLGMSDEDVKSEEESDKEKKKEEKSEKKKKKKNKNKKAKKNKQEDKPIDDPLEINDEELALLTSESTTSGPLEQTCANELESLFKFDPKIIDPSEEMKRNLGKAFSMENRSQESSRSGAKHRYGAKYVIPKMNWPPFRKAGYSMEISAKKGDITFYKYVHSNEYRQAEAMVKMAEDSGQFGFVYEVLNSNPYQLNALLLAAHAAQMQDDVSKSIEYIRWGIYGCESASHALFNASSWKHRLSYSQFENRAFFILLYKNITYCEKRRSYMTALNFSKLLFSLEPEGDPLGMLLMMDTLAIKAKQFDWVKQVYDQLRTWKNPDFLPNWLYSSALVAFHTNDPSADEKLEHALTAFPGIVVALSQENQISFDRETESLRALSHTSYMKETEAIRLLSTHYAKMSSALWKNESVMVWLEQGVRRIGSDYGNRQIDKDMLKSRSIRFPSLSPQMKRCIYLSDVNMPHESTTLTDPFPPKVSRGYDRSGPMSAAQVADENVLIRLLHSLYPDFDENEPLAVDAGRIVNLVRDFFQGRRGDNGDQVDQPQEEEDVEGLDHIHDQLD